MRNYLYSLLTLALACVAGSAWAAGEPVDERILTTWQDGPTDGPGLPIGFTFTPDFEVDGLYYKIIDGGVELTRARGDANDHSYRIDELTIPTSVTYGGITYPVIRIGDGVFYRNIWIASLTIPDGIKSIGIGAFCETTLLTDLHLPSSVESIDKRAFAYSAITNINLTNGVRTIGKSAFEGCKNLKSITFGPEVSEIGNLVFGYSKWIVTPAKGVVVEYIWCTRLMNLYCLESVPAPVDENLFGIISYGEGPKTLNMYDICTLHVPAESVELYKQTAPWNQFKAIYGDGETGISQTIAEAEGIRLEGGRILGEGVMDVYDLGGRQVARGTADQLPTLPAGFYVVRNSHSTAKVLVP